MPRLVRWLGTVGGVGYSPVAPGTCGSAAGVLAAWACARWAPEWSAPLALLVTIFGVFVAREAALAFGGADPAVVVIDELAAMWLVLAVMPQTLEHWGLGWGAFGLFRAFDVIKPPPLRRLERLAGGWGIMLDDLGAAAYTCLVLWIVLKVVHSP